MASASLSIRRNDLCPCLSGRRYKSCCGLVTGQHEKTASAPTIEMMNALALQRRGEVDAAARIYEQALADDPSLADAKHMLGVILLGKGCAGGAERLIREAGEATDWSLPGVRHNYALAVGHLMLATDPVLPESMLTAYARWIDSPRISAHQPLVSVVVPSYNHARYVVDALRSVFRQTYRNLELIVFDDGSKDDSPAVIDALLEKECPFPYHFVARENRGAAATLNEAIARASGEYVNPLNSDDEFEPGRIEHMVERVANRSREWGFSAVVAMQATGEPIPDSSIDERVASLRRATETNAVPFGIALLQYNYAISTGNLFFSRSLYGKLHGFDDLRYNHDWDFAVRALWHAEPEFVALPLYRYRMHGSNTILESRERANAEAVDLFSRYHARAYSERPPNPFAPAFATYGAAYLAKRLASGTGPALPLAQLLALGVEFRSACIGEACDASAQLSPVPV
jgi:glycosyltransferase involved in cell wall biosynthesis